MVKPQYSTFSCQFFCKRSQCNYDEHCPFLSKTDDITFPTVLGAEGEEFRNFLIYDIDPFRHPLAIWIRKVLWKVYNQMIFDSVFVSDHYLHVQRARENQMEEFYLDHFIGALIAAYITKRSVTLVEGSPGCGKTSTIQALSRMITGNPITQKNNIVHCNKGLTEDAWLARIDPSEFIGQRGMSSENSNESAPKWKILWAEWVTNPQIIDLIFDEINRASLDIQNQMLLLMQEGYVQSGIQFSHPKDNLRIFLTRNPHDREGFNLSQLGHAFTDRITQILRVPLPTTRALLQVQKTRQKERFLGYNIDHELQPIASSEIINIATILAQRIPVTDEANRFATYLTREANICIYAPQYDKSLIKTTFHLLCDEKKCHFAAQKLPCVKVIGGSMRLMNNLLKIGKAYAFWLGHSSVTIDLLQEIAPDLICHHLELTADAKRVLRTEYGNDMHEYITDQFIRYCHKRVSERKDVEQRVTKIFHGQGTKEDMEVIIQQAQNDLYLRTDLLGTILDTEKNTLVFRENLTALDTNQFEKNSCLHPQYKQYIQQLHGIITQKGESQKKKQSRIDQFWAEIKHEQFPMKHRIKEVANQHLYELQWKSSLREKVKAQQKKQRNVQGF